VRFAGHRQRLESGRPHSLAFSRSCNPRHRRRANRLDSAAITAMQVNLDDLRPSDLFPASDRLASTEPDRSRVLLKFVLLAAAALGAAYAAFFLVLQAARADEKASAARRLAFYAGALDAELARIESLPGMVAMDPRVAAALEPRAPSGARAAALQTANEYLATASQRIQVEAVYLMDRDGLTVASSNHGQSGSFVGQNYGFRAYFRDALGDRIGRYYAVGATTSRPGYFLAHPVRGIGSRATDGNPLAATDHVITGVAAVKISLQGFEQMLEASGDVVLLADREGVVFLASAPELRYRTLAPLDEARKREIQATRQYGAHPLSAAVPGVNLLSQSRIGRVPSDAPPWAGREVISKAIGPLGWRLVALVETPRAHQGAALAALVAALSVTSLWLAMAHHLRVRARRAELLNLEIEVRQRIAGSTRDLSQRLASQEATLRALRRSSDAAIQTGKLAVLGQMSAALSHELNQPITALMNQVDSAAVLLSRGSQEEARACLDTIRSLSQRMAGILANLRDHARRDSGKLTPTDTRQSLQAAMALVGVVDGRHASGVQVRLAASAEPVVAVAEPVRLEQVLVNLIRNAIEAAQESRLEGRVHVVPLREGGWAVVEVHDNGPGLATEVLARLFEPFFTTKAAGAGLGLGLAVSRMIVEGMGGRLEARNSLAGGAIFSVRLPESRN
jgi:two-component system C4-dicarboxylate transport sensor histidine kinase DctB